MCGIFAIATIKNDAPKRVIKGLKTLEYRGYDSWGIAYLSKTNTIKVTKNIGKIENVEINTTASIAIGHTRWATHGGVFEKNAHPHVSCQNDYAIIHNGIIDNYQQIKTKLQLKHTFISETDSEVVAHLLENFNFFKAFSLLNGLNAVIALDSHTHKIYGAKTGSPLVIGFGKDENFIASDASAIIPYTKKVYFLEDGQGVVLSSKHVEIFDLATNAKVEINPITIDWKENEAELIGYKHYLIKEISEQPANIISILMNSREEIERLTRVIKRSYGTYFVACGTAYHAALAGVYMFSKFAHRHVNCTSAAEFTYLTDFITRGSLVIALSQSGETMDTIESVQNARKHQATIATIVNVMGSSLYRFADLHVLLRVGPEKCVLATKSYMAQLAILFLTAFNLVDEYDEGHKILSNVAKEIERIITGSTHKQIKDLAKKLKNISNIYLLGRGLSYPDALEAALKIKEVSYIHAEGFAGGDLKHGAIALIEKETPVIVFAPLDETYSAIISNAMEVKARGAMVIGVSPKKNPVFDVYIKIADIPDASNLVNIVPMQLLAYYLALERGCDPDKPRNLAKSVTVK